MKHKRVELDVDFIGGVRTLTKEDEQAISNFLTHQKLTSKKSVLTSQSKTKKRFKATA
jgi:hypothetical protein